MDSASSVIGLDKFILRRIPKSLVNLTLPVPVGFTAFRPTNQDHDGLSFFLEDKISAADLAGSARKPGEYFVARLSVQALAALHLTVVDAHLAAGPPGHVVVPEIAYVQYHQDSQAWRPTLIELARLASNDIVWHPQK